MSADIETIVLENIRICKHFSLQLDEYTDLSKNAQLLANVRFVDGDIIRENFLFSKTLVKATGEEIFCITTEYIENGNLQWENCISICRLLTVPQLWSDEIKVLSVDQRKEIKMLSLNTIFCTAKHLFSKLYQKI